MPMPLRPCAVVLSLFAVAGLAQAQTANTFTNATASRLSAAAPVGSADPTEKSYGLADIDKDGDIDVVVGRRTRPAFPASLGKAAAIENTLLMNENGVLTDRTSTLAPNFLVKNATRDTLLADLNGDGWIDCLFADGDSNLPHLLLNQKLDGSGNWLGFANAPAGLIPATLLIDAWTLCSADFVNDGDAYPDVVIGVRLGTDIFLRNLGVDGSGNWLGFVNESSRLGANASTNGAMKSSAAFDANGDGDIDIIRDIANPTGTLQILHNNGTGQFTSAAQAVATGASYNFALGKLDGDNIIDFFAVRNGVDQFRRNLGPGAGDTCALGALGSAPSSTNGFGSICRVGDLNYDGTDDFLVCDLDQEFPDDCARKLNILLNPGTGLTLTDAYPTAVPWEHNGTSDVALIDLDEDGDLDMMVGHCSGNTVYLQDGAPPNPCFADCDQSGGLTIDDFICFQTLFALGDPSADCDGAGGLTIDDFICFQTFFALGC
jgi:FG-GAP-like repeat